MADEMIEKSDDTDVSRWSKEIELALKRDKEWIAEAEVANKTYRNDRRVGNTDHKKKDTFNILWSNVETIRPALYSTVPRPDIRRRFKDADPIGKHVSEILERACSFTLEASKFHPRMKGATQDMLLAGRGVTRIKYLPTTKMVLGEDGEEHEEVVNEEVGYSPVQWDEILLGPGDTWEEIPWIAFEHMLKKAQIKKLSPEFADKLNYDVAEGKSEKEKNEEARVFKRAKVWEIWDKDGNQVLWLADSFKDDFIKVADDPLNLQDFWPIPKPCYSIESTTSMVPITDFSQYETLANNLEDVTNRMSRITKALRVRGIYDSTMAEMDKLFSATDNDMIPAENLSRLIEKGGIDKAIWMLPITTLAEVLLQLRQYRTDTITQVYELTGISDIIRGQSNPNETLGAQRIKADFGSQRLQDRQREIQRYARDLIRMTVEIIGENFSPETLMKMTGLKYPTQQEKQQAQMQLEAMKQQGQQPQQPPQPPAELMEMLSKPTWEELKAVMGNDVLRAYRIDIETDSTIQADQTANQEALTQLMQGVGPLTQGLQPMVEQGVMTKPAAKKFLVSVMRKFKLGREVEDAMMEEGPPEPKPEEQAEQQKQQAEQQKQQADQQMKQAEMQANMQKLQAEGQAKQAEMQMDMQKMQMEMQQSKADHQATMAEIQMKMESDKAKFQFEMRKLQAQPLRSAGNG
jgi:hypothetical protein